MKFDQPVHPATYVFRRMSAHVDGGRVTIDLTRVRDGTGLTRLLDMLEGRFKQDQVVGAMIRTCGWALGEVT